MNIKDSWQNKSFNVVGWGIVVLFYLLFAVAITLSIQTNSVKTFFVENAFLLVVGFICIILFIIILLVSYFEGRSKKQIYICLRSNIEAFIFLGGSYYLNINQTKEPIGFVIISLLLLGIIKLSDAVISLYEYLFNA
ncbi:hypothetical protein [Rossellomorea vietnamensis]|uniref:hypothetical protein n=1 Tax=Rossellomorea vietnamensis TaxID=218284 RepID=UPI001E2D1D0D|nr:hypothetical protein [Rossellomorea vietnamensis]MCC5803221.1 hypothetical protein [Rossellomorea vietnamensis]